MARMTLGARTLIEQVTEARKGAKASTVGEPDGLDVHRTIRFDKKTSEWLAPLLKEIDDERVESVENTSHGLQVTFVGGVEADTREPFPLEAAETVVSDR